VTTDPPGTSNRNDQQPSGTGKTPPPAPPSRRLRFTVGRVTVTWTGEAEAATGEAEVDFGEIDAAAPGKKLDWSKWLPIGISTIAVLLSAASIINQYRFEEWKDARATPQLRAVYEPRQSDTGKRVEDWRCPVAPCQLFDPWREGMTLHDVPVTVRVSNTSETAAAANLRIVLEVTCPFVVYALTCPGCETGEYIHNKPQREVVMPEDFRRVTVAFPMLELKASREILVGLAARADAGCPRTKSTATLQMKITADHNGHFLSGPINVLTGQT